MRKVVRGYSIEPAQKQWLTEQARKLSLKRGEKVGDSEVLRIVLRAAMAQKQ